MDIMSLHEYQEEHGEEALSAVHPDALREELLFQLDDDMNKIPLNAFEV